VIVFVTLCNGTRYAFVGDLVWQLEGMTRREERPWLSRNSDSDAEGTRENLLRMIAIKERLPELIVVPAHDMRAFAEMPTLSQASSENIVSLETAAHNHRTTDRNTMTCAKERITVP